MAILILPAFVFWGLGSVVRSPKESKYIGQIFGRKVLSLEYKDALEAIKNQAILQYGDNFSEIQKYLNLESQAWDRLVLLAEAKKRKINVKDKEVMDLIKDYPYFQKKGRFDNTIYQQVLQYVFHTPARVFEEQIRQNLILAKLYNTVTKDVTLSEEEIKEAYQKENEQISIYYIAGLYSDFAKDIAPSQEEIKDYFTKNSFEFKRPLSFNMEYIPLEENNKDERGIRDKIKKITLVLSKKEGPAKVAKDLGLTLKETGLFTQADPIPGIGWSPQILSLISKLKIGQVLPTIHIDNYYYILRLKERKEPQIPDFEAAKDKVKEALIKTKSQQIAKEKIENCWKALKEAYQMDPKSIDFEGHAKEYGLKSNSTQLFKYGGYIEGIGVSDNFWMTGQKLKENEFSEIINAPSGFYIIKLKTKIPVDNKKFETEKIEFAKGLLLQRKQEYFTKFTEELKKGM